MSRKIGYARVSTRGQATNGNSLEEQINKLTSEGCTIIYKEHFTGTKMDRPEFNKCLEELNTGDTLVITKLDRFARTTVEGVKTVQELLARGIRVHILNMGLVEDTPSGRLIFNIMCSFAEFERDMIVERTQEGRKAAMANGVKMGRTKKDGEQMKYAIALALKGEMSIRKICEVTGVSKATLCRRLKDIKDAEKLKEVSA